MNSPGAVVCAVLCAAIESKSYANNAAAAHCPIPLHTDRECISTVLPNVTTEKIKRERAMRRREVIIYTRRIRRLK
jgi:hypothetical protein